MVNPPRKKINPAVETQILVNCRRRCCLCFFLEGKTDVRTGQIAHIDGNRSNNKADNLVWLCLEHHDQYDSRTSQTKNLTANELKHYKNDLHEIVLKQNLQSFLVKDNSSQATKTEYYSSGYLLGSLLEVYDRELANLERHNRPNGIKLYNLARIAASEEGDFFAARQAFASVLRLGGECEKKGMQRVLNDNTRTASVVSAGENILDCFARIDLNLFASAIFEARSFVIRGESSFVEYDPIVSAPTPAFYPFTQILCRFGRNHLQDEYLETVQTIGKALGDLALSVAMLLSAQDVSLPLPPEVIWMSCGGDRVVPEGEDKRLEPFIWIANQIAHLPEPIYQAALKSFRFILSTMHGSKPTKSSSKAETTIALLRKWMIFPGQATICISSRSKKDYELIEAVIVEMKNVGAIVATAAHAFVAKERALVTRQ